MFTNPYDMDVFYLHPIEHTDPAAGAQFVYNFPARTSGELICLDFNFATDANVANRYLFVTVIISTSNFFRARASTAFVASTANDISCGAGFSPAASGGDTLANQISWPVGLVIPPLGSLLITVTNIQAGDQLSNIATLIKERTVPA